MSSHPVSITAGIGIAEALTQIGLGVYFALAFALVQRHREYLSFALLCVGVALISAGVAVSALMGVDGSAVSDRVAYQGAILAVFSHFSFIVLLVDAPHARLGQRVMAGVAVLFSVGLWFGPFFSGEQELRLFNQVVVARSGAFPTSLGPLGLSFHVLVLMTLLYTAGLVLRAGNLRRFEVGLTLAGTVLATLAALSDSLVMLGWYAFPVLTGHLFSTYAFATALGLVLRYRSVATSLVDTTSSLAEKTNALRESSQVLHRMKRELGRKQQLAAVGELAASIAHEVRNPLAIIVNAVAGLRRPTLADQDRTTLLGILDEESARLNRLVTDLLRFARPVKLQGAWVSVAELVKRAENRVGPPHRLVVEPVNEEKIPRIWADANLLRLVFDNVIANARAAMPDGGVLTVRASSTIHEDREHVSIDVIDTGHGMDGHILARATDPFFTTRPSGTGLGLPIVQRILEAHRGSLRIESTVGSGTQVSMLLPVEHPDDQEVTEA